MSTKNRIKINLILGLVSIHLQKQECGGNWELWFYGKNGYTRLHLH